MPLVRFAVPLLVSVLLVACGAPDVPDAGGPPRDDDAGTDAGVDAGLPDAGRGDGGTPDAGPVACVLDAGPVIARDGGSLVCAPCSGVSPCGPGATCRFVGASTCTGTCSAFGPSCGELGPEPTRVRVTVRADAYGCPARNPGGCDVIHELEPSTGALAVSIRLLTGDGGVTRSYGTVSSMAGEAMRAASAQDLWCVGARDLFAGRCIERSFSVVVEAEAPDAGVVVSWPLRAGTLPPEALFDAVTEVLRTGDHVLRDAGVAWTLTPP